MTGTLKIILIICSIFSFLLCIKKIKQSKLKMSNSLTWLLGSIILIFMSVFSNVVEWVAYQLGFAAPVHFVFFIVITFLLIQTFIDSLHITELNEKIKELNHYLALKEKD